MRQSEAKSSPAAVEAVSAGSVATLLAAFSCETPASSIPNAVRERARLHLLDTIGCGIAAVALGPGASATTLARSQGGRAESSVLGQPDALPAALAALANGTRCHALDFDDTHERGICHSSTVVAPAALAVGEARAADIDTVLDAYILGGEVALRIAIASADGLYARGFHPTGLCGAFGAAAASARLLGLSTEMATNALGIVGSFAAGLFEYLSDGSSTKPLHAGWAAQAGVNAALLAQAGASGPASVIEGRFGLLNSHTGSAARAAGIAADLSEHWEVTNLSIKPYPACHFVHSSTWAAGELAAEHGLRPNDLAEIVVRIPEEGVPLVLTPAHNKAKPRTSYEAKFSLPFTVAHRLVHGDLALRSFTRDSIADQEVLALARRVRFEPIEEPAPSRFAGGARLIARSGDRFDRLVPAAPGSPANPLEREWVLAKFRANAALGLTESGAKRLAELLADGDGRAAFDEVAVVVREAGQDASGR